MVPCVPNSRSNCNLAVLVFEERGKPECTAKKKTLGAKERTNNKLNPHMASMLGFEPRPHWWEASALTIVPLAHYVLMLKVF